MTTPTEWQDRAERAEAEIRAWIKENAPGGWIHALRAELARLREQEPVAYWIPKTEQFCLADPKGRPFARAWEPLFPAATQAKD